MEIISSLAQKYGLHRLTGQWVEKAAKTSFSKEKASINFERFLERLAETGPEGLKRLTKRNIPWIATLFSGSQALTDMAMRTPEWLFWALEPGILDSTRFKRDMRRERDLMLSVHPHSPKEALCDFRNRELMRIGWRDLLKWADTVETLEDLSRLADVSIEGAMNSAVVEMEERFGRPLHSNGAPARFIVLGMGKLGGRELNFSSDIDLIYFYDSDDGETEGGFGRSHMERPRISIKEFYTRVGRQMTSFLNDIGPSGNLYRVDLGLRPEGSRGPIVCSIASAELYYESWGQQWERQMMIKARTVAGDPSLGDEFQKMIRPFVYRKYIDFSVLRDIQLMKEKIDKNLKTGKNKYVNNVKLGKGGIREIEFIIQAYQMIYGGKMPWLAETNSLKALHRIFERGMIGYAQYAQLSDALLFLRDLENRMQITYGRQVQILPEGDELQILALKMNLPDAGKLMAEYSRHTNNANAIFTEFFKEEAPTAAQPPETFLDIDNEDEAAAQLKGMGFQRPSGALAALLHMRDGEPFNHPSTRSRKMFAQILPPLIKLAAACPARDRTLSNLDMVISCAPMRESLYQVLIDFPPALEVLVKTAAYAQNLTEILLNMPDIPEVLSAGPDPVRNDPLSAMPADITVYDKKLDWLRKERNAESLRIGVAYLLSHADPFKMMHQLSSLADSFLGQCLRSLETDLAEKGAPPPAGRFAVIGMGKLGRRELSYGSDLDLMFVYSEEGTKPLDTQLHFTNLSRRLLAAIGGISQHGLAYRVDVRLRPEGEKGIIALSADAAREYYASRGALWERMALCGARAVAGNMSFGEEFLKSLAWFVYGPGLTKKEETEIERMKRKMEREKIKNPRKVPIKYGPGGIVDIEFLTQRMKLAHGLAHPELRPLNTLEMLEAAKELRLPVNSLDEVIRSYRLLRTVETHMRMEYGRGAESLPEDAEQRSLLEDLSRSFFPMQHPLAEEAQEAMERARASFQRQES